MIKYVRTSDEKECMVKKDLGLPVSEKKVLWYYRKKIEVTDIGERRSYGYSSSK